MNEGTDSLTVNYPILNTIGNTPVIEIKRLNPNPGVTILAKLESFNPGGSIKDRVALQMIREGERSGKLTGGKTVIEATSGNTGIGLALVCSVMGYPLTLAMSESVSKERRKILKARGAEILLTPAHLGTDGAIEEVYRMAREHPEEYFLTDQFNNPANHAAHYHGTAPEIWRQTGGNITAFIATMGTSGTVMGAGRRLKEYNPKIQIIGVEPYLGHKIQGLKNMKESYQPGIYDKNRLDKKVNVDDEEAFEMTRQLALKEGLLVGMSSGAAVVAAIKEAAAMTEGTVVVILPDGGERYLSTEVFIEREKADLRLFNALTRGKEFFMPREEGKVSIYSCGLSANGPMHIGLCRGFVFTDLLSRYFKYRGSKVNHVVNIVDLDDKTIEGSEREGLELPGFTQKYIDIFKKDLAFLGVEPARAYPRVSEHLDDIVDVAGKLADKGVAYEKLRSLYFDISRLPGYGKLSGIDLDKIKLGATVELDEYEKENPRDFTLLKRSKLSELKRGIYMKTRWGNVRPSLHIQCAAVSRKYLGEHFDIHAGSREKVFPHHENELAISRALSGKPMASYWLHCDRVLVEGRKIDHQEEGPTLKDLSDRGYSGREIRFFLLSTHYRRPLKFSFDRLLEARQTLKRFDAAIEALKNVTGGANGPELDQSIYDLKHGFIEAMNDDLNISAALAAVFKVIKKINALIAGKRIDPGGAARVVEQLRRIDSVLQVIDFGDQPTVSQGKIKDLIAKREQARKEKNFALADQLRDQLIQLGVTPRDTPLDTA